MIKGRRINKKRLLMLIGAVVFFIAGLIYSVHLLFSAKPYKEEVVFELGTQITDDPSNFIKTGFIADKIINPDISAVDAQTPGEYAVGITYFGKDLSTTIRIEDTTAPEIILKDGPIYFLKDTEVSASDLIMSIKDADKNVIVTFDENLPVEDSIKCTTLGMYSAVVIAKDSSGNVSRCAVSFTVDTAPELVVFDDFYVAEGADDNILDHVFAYDITDGDITDSITCSLDEIDVSVISDTKVTFSVSDSYGFTDERDITIHVMDPEDIQQLIGAGEISRQNATIIGAYNVYDTGLIQRDNFEETLIEVMPTVVHLEAPESTGNFKTGSGYIAEIGGDYIYIITNKHVIGSAKTCSVFFYTGDFAEATVVGCAKEYDVAVVKVPLEQLPESFDTVLSTVHIDLTYWENLDEKINLGIETMDTDGTIIHYTYGTLVNRLQNFSYFEPNIQTEMSLRLRPGDSGSAVFDIEGRLIGMAFAYSISPERDWAVPLDEIVKAYEEITGRRLYTY